ncbi:CPBP family intramembrane glutamic endopeptidase [Salinirubellus sp. GCM10025818]|uniref:CPBP family intramembrane glutamic endopeptidase n=1 Tax=Salinirubellus TaxID=2162630 RepID=UPI0030CD7794
MASLVERRPVAFTLGFGAAMIALTVVVRLALEALVPSLTLHGIGLVLNWLFVAIVVGLVAWLGWWEKIRLTTPVNRRALVYLLPFGVMVLVPLAFGLAIPEVSLVEGTTLPSWAALVVIVVGVALGAALSEELLYRGVFLRALEPRGRVLAVVLPAVVFGLSHVSQIILGNSMAEWLPQMILIIPLGIGLGAVAFRLKSLWPLVLWHFAVDVTGLLAANPSPLMELAAIGLIGVVFVMGVGLLWQDRRLPTPPRVAQA